ncbi:MAG: hypothetical protein HKN82_03995 [Akkermansiaceae bacterium]|nr:hypothetical protein [Akkermansiaceae bacterium]NNM29389.1 hypothetical protein [Akkermansiaceae bacterium]
MATLLTGFDTSSSEEPVFPVTPLVPTALKPQVSIAGDFEALQKMGVSTVALRNYKGIYRGGGYEDIPHARVLFPDLFVTLPDRSMVTKSKIRGYYQALFCSWPGDDRAIGLLEQLRLSNDVWIAYGASTIHQGEQDGAD